MPWKVSDSMSLRSEFVVWARRSDANLTQLCRRFGISRPCAYKWLGRVADGDAQALRDRSRRPHNSPTRTAAAVEQKIVEVRQAHPAWGPRKIRRVLINQGESPRSLPAPSTIGSVLLRRGLVDPSESRRHTPYQRFEQAQPNDLWQMDFKGHVAMSNGRRCHPLTVLDDCSRFNVALTACGDETANTVRPLLIGLFERYGLPRRILCDNGGCWGGGDDGPWSKLAVWLLLHGVAVTHGRPHHPQTQGKDERFHRTLNVELLARRTLRDLHDGQQLFDAFRHVYNHVRPHEALDLDTPITRYHPSARPFQANVPPPAYDRGVTVRKVDSAGRVYWHNRPWRIGKAFTGQQIGLRPGPVDGVMTVLLDVHEIGTLDPRQEPGVMCQRPKSVNDVPEQAPTMCPV